MRVTRKIFLLLVTPLCLVLLIPAAAQAHWEGTRKALVYHGFMNWSGPCVWLPGGNNAKACYNRGNDRIYILDQPGDGMRTGVLWRTDYGDMGPPPNPRTGVCWWPGQSGPMGDWPGYCDYNFREGRRVYLKIGVCDRDAYTCGKPNPGSGWHGWSGWVSGRT